MPTRPDTSTTASSGRSGTAPSFRTSTTCTSPVPQLPAEPVEQLGEAVDPVDECRALPGEMVQADVLQLDPLGLHVQVAGEATLEPDGHVAQADGPVPLVQERLGHDAHGVGEVDQPRVGVAPRGDLLRDV